LAKSVGWDLDSAQKEFEQQLNKEPEPAKE
jgi:hypothetical protein